MTQLKKEKFLECRIRFNSETQLNKLFREIKKQIEKGNQYKKMENNDGHLEYSLDWYAEFDYRVETINENRCMIIPSSMNKE